MEMASAAEFVKNPSEELLKTLSKEQLLKVEEHFDVECSKQAKKDTILSSLKGHLVEQEVLPNVDVCSTEQLSTELSGSPEPVKVVPHVSGFGAGLTFEQQKELLMLQHQQALEREEHEKGHTFELKRLKLIAQLREARLKHKQEQQSLEH